MRLLLGLIALAQLLLATPNRAAAACDCDCNGDGTVSIAELIRVVNIGLGGQSASTCDNLPTPCEVCVGPVQINGLIRCVNNSLDGCPIVEATSTPAPNPATPTSTATAEPTPVTFLVGGFVVERPDGRGAVAGVQVVIEPLGWTTSTRESDGRFNFEGIPPGEYTLRVTQGCNRFGCWVARPISVAENTFVFVSMADFTPTPLPPSPTPTPLPTRTPRQRFSVCGCASTNQFSAPCDDPVDAALLPIGRQADANSKGVFCFDNLRPGDYSIQLASACGRDGCWVRPYDVTVEDRDVFVYVPLARTFPPTPPPTRWSVTPTGTPSLVGRVRHASGAYASNYTAHLEPSGREVSVARPNTVFRFDDLEADYYTVTIDPPCDEQGCYPPTGLWVRSAHTELYVRPRTHTPTPTAEGCSYGLRSHFTIAHPCPSLPGSNVRAVDVLAGGSDCCWTLWPSGRLLDFSRPIHRCGDWRIVFEVARNPTTIIHKWYELRLSTAESTPVSTFVISQERRCTHTRTRTPTPKRTKTPTRTPR